MSKYKVFLVNALRFALVFCCFLYSSPSFSRDMHGRWGLGYNSQFSNVDQTNGVPAVSVKYGMTRDIAFEFLLGLHTASPTNSLTAVKLFKNIFLEDNLNFYFVLGGGLLSADSSSSAEFLVGFGAEFFIPGLESLGFAMETGASLSNVTGSFALKTMGVSFLNAGIHFYF